MPLSHQPGHAQIDFGDADGFIAGKKVLLIIDELGYVPFTAVGAELLCEVFSRRYEHGAMLVTLNLPFDEWTSVLWSERLTGSAAPATPKRATAGYVMTIGLVLLASSMVCQMAHADISPPVISAS